MYDGKNNENDFKKEEIQITIGDTFKSIQTQISFNIDDLYLLRSILKLLNNLNFNLESKFKYQNFFNFQQISNEIILVINNNISFNYNI